MLKQMDVLILFYGILQEKRVLPSLTSIEELPLLLFPIDTDVLSLELESAFKEFHVENDPTSMYYVAKALVYLQRKYGVANSIFGKGQAAKYVYDLMQSIQQETGVIKPQVSHGNKNIFIRL